MVVYRNSAFFSPSKKTFSLITLNLKVFFYYLRFKLQMINPKDSFIEKGMNSSYTIMAGSIFFLYFSRKLFLISLSVFLYFFLYFSKKLCFYFLYISLKKLVLYHWDCETIPIFFFIFIFFLLLSSLYFSEKNCL